MVHPLYLNEVSHFSISRLLKIKRL